MSLSPAQEWALGVLMALDRQDKADQQSLDVRRTLAARGASLELVLPEFFGGMNFASANAESDIGESISDEPVEVVFDSEMSLEEALKVFSQVTVSGNDLPAGELP